MIHVSLSVSPIKNRAGEVIGSSSIARDITERKRVEGRLRESEERFHLLMEHANDAIIYIDLQGVIQWASHRAAVLLGCPIKELLGRRFATLLTPEAARLGDARLEAIRRGEPVEPLVVFEVPRPNATVVHAEANVTSVRSDGNLIGRLLVARDITERKIVEGERERLFTRVRADQARLQALSRQLIGVQEAERRHLARELHDEIGQALTVLKIRMQQAQGATDAETVSSNLKEGVRIVDQTLEQVRTLALDLRPSMLDDLGLAWTLRWLLDHQAKKAGLAVSFSAEVSGPRLPPAVELACFRIAQEALTNVVRHAKAGRVSVQLCGQARELVLMVWDDGTGFDINAAIEGAKCGTSMGLTSMQERAGLVGGHVDIRSAPGQGTQLFARFPVPAPTAPASS